MILLHLLVLSCDGTQPGGPDLAAGPQLKKRHPGGGGAGVPHGEQRCRQQSKTDMENTALCFLSGRVAE